MNKGIKEIMIAIGGGNPEDGDKSPEAGMNSSALPKKRKIYVNDQVYSRLMESGEAEDAESMSDMDGDDMESDPSGKPPISIDPKARNSAPVDGMDMTDEEIPEGFEFDDDEDDESLKKVGRLFGKMKRG